MSGNKNIDGQEVQKQLAGKFNDIAIRRLTIEQMEEQIGEYIDDLVALYKEAGNKKTKGDVNILVDVYVDAEKARKEEKAKIDKSNIKLTKMEEAVEELSVLAQYRLKNIHDLADEYLEV